MDDAKRKARFDRWEENGLEAIKADLLTGGHRIVGGSPEVRRLAQEWVRMKEEEQKEIVQLKPNLHGVGIDLKEAGRKLWRKVKPKAKS